MFKLEFKIRCTVSNAKTLDMASLSVVAKSPLYIAVNIIKSRNQGVLHHQNNMHNGNLKLKSTKYSQNLTFHKAKQLATGLLQIRPSFAVVAGSKVSPSTTSVACQSDLIWFDRQSHNPILLLKQYQQQHSPPRLKLRTLLHKNLNNQIYQYPTVNHQKGTSNKLIRNSH